MVVVVAGFIRVDNEADFFTVANYLRHLDGDDQFQQALAVSLGLFLISFLN
jgi:hypothetical protein